MAFEILAGNATDSAVSVDSLSDIPEQLKQGLTVWLDLIDPNAEEISKVAEWIPLDDDGLARIIHGNSRPHLEEHDDFLLLVLYGMLGADIQTEPEPRKLVIVIVEKLIITIHSERLLTLIETRERIQKKKGMLAQGLDLILFRILDGIVDKYSVLVDQYEAKLQRIEDASLSPTADEGMLTRTSLLRNSLLEIRSIANAKTNVLGPIFSGDCDYIREELEIKFDRISGRLMKVVDDVDSMRDRLIGVHQNVQIRIADKLNQTMKTLTVVATIVLPLTLVAGIYGMNLKLWPSDSDPNGFAMVMGAMGVMLVGLLIYFKKQKWL